MDSKIFDGKDTMEWSGVYMVVIKDRSSRSGKGNDLRFAEIQG